MHKLKCCFLENNETDWLCSVWAAEEAAEEGIERNDGGVETTTWDEPFTFMGRIHLWHVKRVNDYVINFRAEDDINMRGTTWSHSFIRSTPESTAEDAMFVLSAIATQ